MTVRLKRLKLKAFRSFVDENARDLPPTGLVLVRGINKDTGGSSGAGKSTFNMGVAHLMGHSPYPATALQSWLTDEPMQLEGVFDTPEGEAVLRRGKKNSLKVGEAKALTGAKAIEERLQALTGLPPSLLEVLTYRGQRRASAFLSMTDTKKKEFLSTVLGLDKLEEAYEAAKARVKELLQDEKALESTVESLQDMLAEQRRALVPVTLVDTWPCEQKVNAAREWAVSLALGMDTVAQQLERAKTLAQEQHLKVLFDRQGPGSILENHLDQLKNDPLPEPDQSKLHELFRLEREVSRRLNIARASYQEKRDAYRVAFAQAHAERAKLLETVSRADEVDARLLRLVEQLQKLEKSVCPTCERTWKETEHTKLALNMEIVELQSELQHIESARALIASLDEQLANSREPEPEPLVAKLDEMMGKVSQDISKEQEALDSFTERERLRREGAIAQAALAHNEFVDETKRLATAASAEASADVDRLQLEVVSRGASLRDAEREQHRLEQELAAQRAGNSQVLAEHEAAAKAVKATEDALSARVKELERVAGQRKAEADFAELVGREGFLGAIFDEVLAEITDEVNTLLSSIANTAHVTLSFQSQSFTQKGTVKKSITPIVSIGGKEAPLESGLSGGMLTSVELGVDLAVSAVVSRRTGSVPGWLILDEPFSGLGPVEMECCLEILQRYQNDRLILVVDHASEVKEMFTQTIDIEYANGVSRFV